MEPVFREGTILTCCPICGSHINLNEYMQFTYGYRITKKGKPSKSRKKSDICPMECSFLSCENPDCNFRTDCDLSCDNYPDIEIWIKDMSYYYRRKGD